MGTKHGTSLVNCGLMCSLNRSCLSFNYCSPKTCQLNSLDIFSDNAQITKGTKACGYYGMKKNDAPRCWQEGIEKSIENDLSPGPCEINLKRHDASWGEFEEYVEIDTDLEWKKMKRRDCFLARHRGIENCVNNETVAIEWLKLVHVEMNHDDAISECRRVLLMDLRRCFL